MHRLQFEAGFIPVGSFTFSEKCNAMTEVIHDFRPRLNHIDFLSLAFFCARIL